MQQPPSYRVPDVDVGTIRDMRDSRVKVDDVAGSVIAVQVGVEALDEGGLAGSSHAWS